MLESLESRVARQKTFPAQEQPPPPKKKTNKKHVQPFTCISIYSVWVNDSQVEQK